MPGSDSQCVPLRQVRTGGPRRGGASHGRPPWSRPASGADIRCPSDRWEAGGRAPTAGSCISWGTVPTEGVTATRARRRPFSNHSSKKEDKMPYVTIAMREGKTLEQKRQLAKAVTDAVTRSLGVKPEAVSIVLHDLPATNFAREGILLSDRT
ncbi:MAG: 4-oxalocrotonate tautomerase family protein [Candidatus Methylomirabilota bacterium]